MGFIALWEGYHESSSGVYNTSKRDMTQSQGSYDLVVGVYDTINGVYSSMGGFMADLKGYMTQ